MALSNQEMIASLRSKGYSINGKTITPPARPQRRVAEMSDTELAYRLMKLGYAVDFRTKTITPPSRI